MATNENELSPVAMALAAYLENYEPSDDESNMHLKTTEAIERDLADMVDTQPGEVAAFMVAAGYRIKWRSVDGKHGWAMRYKRKQQTE